MCAGCVKGVCGIAVVALCAVAKGPVVVGGVLRGVVEVNGLPLADVKGVGGGGVGVKTGSGWSGGGRRKGS